MVGVSAAYISAIVAALAVVIGGAMQYLTLRYAKEDSKNVLQTSERTARIAALADATSMWEQGLREDLARYATLSYEVEAAYDFAMAKKLSWPGDSADDVAEVETIFNRVLLRLDWNVPSERALIESAKAMREDRKRLWIDRRDHLVEMALEAFRVRWASNLNPKAVVDLGLDALDGVAGTN